MSLIDRKCLKAGFLEVTFELGLKESKIKLGS